MNLKSRCVIVTILMALQGLALGQQIETQRVSIAQGELRLIDGRITGDQIVDYEFSARRGQILSVDLQASNTGTYFNILPKGEDAAIFIGSTSGAVADVPAPADGDYVVRTYLVRAAARRDEKTSYTLGIGLGAPEFADGLSGGPDYWAVNVDPGAALNLREGPATRYPSVAPLRNGDVLQNRGCRLTGGERWCSVRVSGVGTTGWTAGNYLVETGAPRTPETPAGGPVGNGNPFDATGMVPCAMGDNQPMQQCPFGVIRSGPGNAGVWIALGNGEERQFLFEGGSPVATSPAVPFDVNVESDTTVLRVGTQSFRIPAAVVNGG